MNRSVTAALAAALFALGAAAIARGNPAPAAPRRGDGYIVVPFQNKSPVKSLDWMATALPVTIAEKLEAHPSLRAAYGSSILDGMTADFDEPGTAARATDKGARWVFAGSFSRPNWKAEVTVRLYEVASDTSLSLAAESSQVGAREQLLDLLDKALLDVVAKKGWPVEGEGLAALRRRPTRDLYAFTIYGRALNAFYGIKAPENIAVAEKELWKVVRIDPKFAEAQRMLGLVLLGRGETGKAATRYAMALDLRPGYYQALVGLARLYRAENRRQPAEEMAARALEIRPWDEEMRYLLGQLLFEGGDYDKSLVHLQKVVADHPHHLGARRALVQVYAGRGDVEALAAELAEVALLAPEDLDVRLDLGAALMRLGKHDRAVAAFEEVLKRRPRHPQALKLSGDLYRKIGDKDRAIAAYERMRRVAPDDPRPYFLLGAVYMEMGKDDKAEAILQEVVQFPRYIGEMWIDLGALALKRGEIKRADIYLSRAVAREPNRPKAHFNYALVLNATNQRDKALAELRSASDLDPDDPEIPYLAGVIHLRLGRLDEAKLAFIEALKRQPAHADAQHNLALLEDLEKRYNTERAGVGSQ